ncbi:hypothetical protein GGI12_002132 [Dipsacomyces acuminosporus]|nr:hypothetical protein GGI12_002132 [Dipsacomyces acuminosporus]
MTRDGNFLGIFDISGTFLASSSVSEIGTTFELDDGGILRASAVDNSTSEPSSATTINRSCLFKNAFGRHLNRIKDMLADEEKFGSEPSEEGREIVPSAISVAEKRLDNNLAEAFAFEIEESLKKRHPSLTEEQRIQAAAELGFDIDPVGTGDRIMVAVGFSVLGLTAILVILAWIHRHYRPIQTKGLKAITLMLMCGVLWIIGSFVVNGVVDVVGVWSHCRVWILWCRLVFTYLYFFLLIFRAYELHRIFVLKKPCHGWSWYLPIISMAVFTLSFGIASQLVSAERTIKYLPDLHMCTFGRAYHYVCFAIGLVFWAIYTVYIVLIRNIRSSFNEFRENLVIYIAWTVMQLELMVFRFLKTKFPLRVRARIPSAALDVFFVVLPVWILLGYPTFMCLFRREEYLARWFQRVSDDNLAEFYKRQERKVSIMTTTLSKSKKARHGRPAMEGSITFTVQSHIDAMHPSFLESGSGASLSESIPNDGGKSTRKLL